MAGAALLALLALLSAVPAGAAAAAAGPGSVVTPAALPGATGMAVDAQGRLYVANIAASRITVIDPDTGAQLEQFGPEQGVTFPEDLALGPDGSLYWTGFLTGDVGRIDPDGRGTIIANVGPGANPIAFHPDGRLFVARCAFADGLYEVDPAGVAPVRVVAEGIGAGCALNGMDVGPDGRLYGPQPFLGRIVAVDVDSGAVDVVTEDVGTTAFGVDVAPDGSILAVDGPQLRRFDPVTGAGGTVAALDFLPDNLVLDDATGAVYVSSIYTAEVVEVAPDGAVRTVSPGGTVNPQGVAVVGRGRDRRLLVSSVAGVRAVDPATGAETDVLPAPQTGQPSVVTALSADRDRWVATAPFLGSVLVFDGLGGAPAATVDGLVLPVGAVLLGDDVVVAEASGRVLRVPLADPAAREVVTEAAGSPGGIVRDGHGVWVTDTAGGRVLQVLDRGRPLPTPRVLAAGLDRPEGIAVSGREVVVVEAGPGRVTAIRPGGRRRALDVALTPANPPLPGLPATLAGIAAGPGRTVYVADPLTNRVVPVDLRGRGHH